VWETRRRNVAHYPQTRCGEKAQRVGEIVGRPWAGKKEKILVNPNAKNGIILMSKGEGSHEEKSARKK